jgi:DNA polymerase-4
MPRVIFHVDMDAFFASIEQRDHPEYLGKPVIVGSPPDQRGVVCAASYEARKFHVRSAMPSRTAGKLCPHGIFVRPRMAVYRDESAKILAIMRSITPMVERVSVDEAYLDVSAAVDAKEDPDEAIQAALPLARQIKQLIKEKRRLTASIGVSSNKFLAKLGSDFQKPDGLTTILDRDRVSFLKPLPIRSIHGVGPVTAKALQDHGLTTIEDLQKTTFDLGAIVGSFAGTLKERAFGIDERPLDLSDERKSISAENTFLNDTDHRPVLRTTLKEMAGDVAATLVKDGLAALTVQIKVRYSDFSTFTRQIRLQEPVSHPEEIYRLACFLLARHQLVKQPLRLLGIGVSTLVSAVREQLVLRM